MERNESSARPSADMQSDHTATAWAVLKIRSNINHVIKMKNIHIKSQENIMTAGCGVSVV